MRLFIASVAALLALVSPVLAATYEFDLTTGSAFSDGGVFSGFINLAVPTSGQNMSLTATVNNPDNAPYAVAEFIGADFCAKWSRYHH